MWRCGGCMCIIFTGQKDKFYYTWVNSYKKRGFSKCKLTMLSQKNHHWKIKWLPTTSPLFFVKEVLACETVELFLCLFIRGYWNILFYILSSFKVLMICKHILKNASLQEPFLFIFGTLNSQRLSIPLLTISIMKLDKNWQVNKCFFKSATLHSQST